jgi:site-specific DNA-methyltransferase (adenine-specific)
MDFRVITGDCVEVMKRIPASSVDAIVTDPPYGLKFMGKGWDDMGHGSQQQAWHYRWAIEAHRVLKPGGHMLAFGGTRTYHRLASAIEDAGFEIRDQMQWLYGTGFPKSHNISKAIDKAAGAEREVVGRKTGRAATPITDMRGGNYGRGKPGAFDSSAITAPATPEAEQWEGWGTALKPAHEPIVVARKPFKGTVAANVLEHGTGGLNIDVSRIGSSKDVPASVSKHEGGVAMEGNLDGSLSGETAEHSGHNPNIGRWPANVILDEEAGAMLDERAEGYGRSAYPGNQSAADAFAGTPTVEDQVTTIPANIAGQSYSDSGGASRFFYCAKASKSEREAGLEPADGAKRANVHPTVKPVALMEYLVRMVTPPEGVVLDPFTGSGTTGIAATIGGFRFFGIEFDPEYASLAERRIKHWNGEV